MLDSLVLEQVLPLIVSLATARIVAGVHLGACCTGSAATMLTGTTYGLEFGVRAEGLRQSICSWQLFTQKYQGQYHSNCFSFKCQYIVGCAMLGMVISGSQVWQIFPLFNH